MLFWNDLPFAMLGTLNWLCWEPWTGYVGNTELAMLNTTEYSNGLTNCLFIYPENIQPVWPILKVILIILQTLYHY